MTQDHATPVPRRALAIVPAGTEAGPAPVPPVPDASTETGTESVAGARRYRYRWRPPERARLAVRRWAGTAAEGAGAAVAAIPAGSFTPCGTGSPRAMAEHRAYMKSRAWVPPELTGKSASGNRDGRNCLSPADRVPRLKAAARIVDGAAERPLRMLMLAVFVSALIFVLLHL